MRKRLVAVLVSASFVLSLDSSSAPSIGVMLLDGESGGSYHKWQRVTPVLKKMLDETGLFAVTVVTAPPAGVISRPSLRSS